MRANSAARRIGGAMFWGVAIVALAPAQSDWSAEEAGVAAMMQRVADHGWPGWSPFGRVLHIEDGPDGMRHTGSYWWRQWDARTMARGEGFVLYAWRDGSDGRTFAVGAARTVVCTGELLDGPPAWTAALGAGGAEDLAKLLVVPGKGMDGRLWMPLSTQPPVRTRVTVRDSTGAPLAATVVCAPLGWFEDGAAPAPGKVAAGFGAAGADGVCSWSGLPAEGLGFAVTIDDVRAPGLTVREAPTGLELVVDAEAFARMRAVMFESAAIATLKNLSSAQAQMQACGVADADGDGRGEYAFLAELSGAVPVASLGAPGGEQKVSPPVLSTVFAKVEGGCVLRNGYLYQVYLPGKDGWVAENATGGRAGVVVDPDRAEVRWCAYAWPVEAGKTGSRVFFTDFTGDVFGSNDADAHYSGRDRRPPPQAGYATDAPDAKPAANATGTDGRTWVVIG